MRAGRKRKPGLRYPSGKLKREETEREAMATALAARQRHYGVTAKQARDERLGSALGLLNLQGLISDPQYDAGVKFARLYYSHHIISGLPTPTPQSISGLMIHVGLLESYGSVEADETIFGSFVGNSKRPRTPWTSPIGNIECARPQAVAAALPCGLRRRGHHAVA
jgi:hypothetical protein